MKHDQVTSNVGSLDGSVLPQASRRRFLQGSALTVAFSLAPVALLAQQAAAPARAVLPGNLNTNRMLDGWLRINANGSVTVFTGKVELGQGILTALCQIVSDELDVDYKRLDIISGDTTLTPNEGVTSGSQSIQDGGTALRFASAEARDILLQLASAKLGVAAADLRVNDGTISAPSGAKTSYWELTGAAANADAFKREATAKAQPKPASQHRAIGQSAPRRDIPAKVTGGAAYVQDMRLPGMLFGRVVRPASPRAKLLSVDEAGAKALPGVVAVLRDGSFLAVAAVREEQAIAAMQALKQSAKWEEKADMPPSGAPLFAHMKGQRSQDTVVGAKANAAAAATGVKQLSAHYTRPFQAHASIGPSCAVAQFQNGKMQVWSHSQGVYPLRADMAKALRMPVASITVSHREGSGCYGHNGADDVALDAALLARATNGKPVMLQWTREDEFAWEPYGSAMAMALNASLDANGKVVDWQHELWSHTHSTRPYDPDGCNLLAAWHLAEPLPAGPSRNIPQPNGGSDRNAIPLYDFAQQKTINHLLLDRPVRVSAHRTLGAYGNVFAAESFIDELALAAGADPVEFRLRHLSDPRAKAVIEATAEKASWKSSSKGDGQRGRGIAFSRYKNSAVYCAVIVDVLVDRASGALRVERAWSAVDAGLVINPDGLRNQIEGGIVQSTSWTLLEAVNYDNTRMLTRAWSDYPILRFSAVPTIEVTLINRPNERPLGVGEGSQGPTVAAIANAFVNATGKRLRDLPFTADKVRVALA